MQDAEAAGTGPLPCHEVFAQRADAAPEAIAVTCDGASISYGELNRRANRLARRLRGRGVSQGTLVGLSMHRSIGLLVAMIGIQKAAAAYVPLDPAYPSARIRHIARDSGIGYLVTDGRPAEWLAHFRGETISLEESAAEPAAGSSSDDDPGWSCDPAAPAYVIYTSGSTGLPKGVLITHANVSRLFLAAARWFAFDERDTWSFCHSYAFDFSVWEIWGALVHGGRIVVVSRDVARSPHDLLATLRREGVTVLNHTPSAFYQLIRADDELGARSAGLALREVIFGGEALDLARLKPWLARHGDRRPRLVNMYGITETTVHVTYRPVSRRDVADGLGSVIGTGLPDLRLYVLDAAGGPAAPGARGELFVAGAGLADGYLNRPALTAERFVPDPFGGGPGMRMYRTGDIVRWRAEDDLEYLGRADNQVNLRGFRIELGEVEAALAGHPAVSAAVVLLRDDDADPHLAAYVASADESLSEPGLRRYVMERLPDYMVPRSFAVLAEFPLTENGKVDRDGLRAVRQDPGSRSSGEAGRAGPRNDVEATLARAWADVMGLDGVGIDDNFFAIGGDSIRSIQVLAKAKDLGVEFAPIDLLRQQTIRKLAPFATRLGDGQPAGMAPFGLLTEADQARLPAGVTDAYPLTRTQAGMIYHSELTAVPGVASAAQSYHNVTTFHIVAPYSEPAWRLAIGEILARHEILRTSFDLDSYGEPLQLVHADVAPPVSFADLRQISGPAQQERVDAHFRVEVQTPFDYASAPMIRFHVQRRSDDSCQLFVAEHHAILDGWSERSLMTELFGRYHAAATGRATAPAPAPRSRFRTFVGLEREAMLAADQRSFWTARMSDATATALPRWRAAGSAAEMRFVERPLDESLSGRVAGLARTLGVPVRVILLAAHLKVMGALGGTDDVLTGVVYNGRVEEPDGDQVMGVFLNTLPFRARLGEGTWAELIRQTQRLDVEIQAFRRYPMSEIQHETGISPLFETFFNFTNFHVYDAASWGAGLTVLAESGVSPGSYAFGAEFMASGGGAERLLLGLRYDRAHFEPEQIGFAFEYYANALTDMTADAARRHRSLPLLSQAERRWLSEWNATGRAFDEPHVLHALVARQAERTPGLAAVRFEGRNLSYRELNEWSDDLARRLFDLGVRPGDFVGVCAERSLGLVVSLLAVLKAGAGYVPISTEDPPARMRAICRSAGLSVVLCGARWLTAFGQPGVHAEPVDDDRARLAAAAGPGPGWRRAGQDDHAYMIFTSGSTGRPKGVVLSHRAVCNRLLWMQSEYRLEPGERVLQKTPFTFDVSVWEFFWPLMVGATLVVAKPDGHRDPGYLCDLIAAESITTVHFVPSMLQAFLDDPGVNKCGSLTRVFCSGEALSADLQRRFFERVDAPLHNLYGPTEAAIDVTFWACAGDDRPVVPIGRPIANTEIHILDEGRLPVPVGVVGELYIGGTGLADGYFGQAGLTAERFVDGLRADGSPVRLYRTGDLARYLPDGVIEYAGRSDSQVKIRGFRVELGEIEAVLADHPDVRECAVLYTDDRLVAYTVPREAGAGEQTSLAAFVSDRLPGYMVPSVWHRLPAMPLTTSGKLDRKALPRASSPAGLGSVPVAPRDESERRLAALWEQVLGVRPASVHDGFFRMGGHSLTALRLITLIRGAFHVDLPLAVLPDADTIAQQASWLREHTAHPREDAMPPGALWRGTRHGFR